MTKTTGSGSGEAEHEVDDFVTAVLTASRVLVGVSARSLDAVEHAVTVAQLRTLVVLSSRGETNLNGLADRLGVNASTAVRMVDRLVALEFVSRQDNPDNRREVRLALTRAGADLVRAVTERRRREIATIVSRMPRRHRAELVAALTAFAEAADEPQAGSGGADTGW